MNSIKKQLKWTVLAFCCAIAMVSCKDDDDDNFSLPNQEFVTRAASSNNFEVAAGALAQTRGTTDAIKHYGQHMVTDHTATGVELKSLATTKGWNAPVDMQPKEQENFNRLNELNGVAFDREFAEMMVVSHQEAVSLFQQASSNRGVPDGDLRSWAGGKVPKLKEHLQEAMDLRRSTNP